RMAGLEQHREHLPPQLHRREALEELQLAARDAFLVTAIGFFERMAPLVVQIRHIGRREQRPVAAFDDALHEQVWNPVRSVHVVRAAAIVASVLAELEEFLEIELPPREIRGDGALALAAAM